MNIALALIVIGLLVMWYPVHRIVYKNDNKRLNIIIFAASSIILYLILSYCMMELLNFRYS